jgi:hypothetical protein
VARTQTRISSQQRLRLLVNTRTRANIRRSSKPKNRAPEERILFNLETLLILQTWRQIAAIQCLATSDSLMLFLVPLWTSSIQSQVGDTDFNTVVAGKLTDQQHTLVLLAHFQQAASITIDMLSILPIAVAAETTANRVPTAFIRILDPGEISTCRRTRCH